MRQTGRSGICTEVGSRTDIAAPMGRFDEAGDYFVPGWSERAAIVRMGPIDAVGVVSSYSDRLGYLY